MHTPDAKALMTRAEFCRRVGITQETLRHYVERGLIHPQRQAGNQYQMYSLADAAVVFRIREMRSLHLSLDSIADELNYAGAEGFARSTAEREALLLDRKREIEREIALIKSKQLISERLLNPQDSAPRLHYYNKSVDAYYDGTKEGAERVRALADRFPYSYGVLKFPLHPKPDQPPYQLGMMLPCSALSFGPPLDVRGYHHCARMRVLANFDIPDLSEACAAHFKSVVDYANLHRYRIINDIVCVVHHVYRANGVIGGVVTAGVGVDEP